MNHIDCENGVNFFSIGDTIKIVEDSNEIFVTLTKIMLIKNNTYFRFILEFKN